MKNITQLLEKYSKTGPRYTSYPTAPNFSKQFGEIEWEKELLQSQNKGRDLSLYFHIPFCDTLCYYCGCHMIATKNYYRATEYLDLLAKEIDLIGRLTSPNRTVQQVHWGGGTPTFLNPEDIRQLSNFIRSHFHLAPGAEIACEVDPRELTRDHVSALAESGFNRISLGVQDLDAQVQESVNRVQPESLVRQVYGWMREERFKSINMDLMVGLPHQTLESFSGTLEKIISMAPDRLAIFNYAHLPNLMKHQKLIKGEELPDFQTRLELHLLIAEKLAGAGYIDIGMDHFARADDDLVRARANKTLWRNFQGYTTHKTCDLYGFGVSGISQTDEVYAQNFKTIDSYREKVENGRLATERGIRISFDDRIRREAIMQIMCDTELNIESFSRKWLIDFNDYFSDALVELRSLEEDGLVEISSEKIRVTEIGHIFLRNIAMPFDAYLKKTESGKISFSQTL